MANLQAQGGAPVSLVDASGTQYVVPLTLVSFAAAGGAADASGFTAKLTAPQAAALATALPAWLQNLAGQGLLYAGSLPATPPAFTLTARDGGATGNDIVLTITKVTPVGNAPALTTLDAAVTTTQSYPDLTLAGIAATLGTTAGGGSKPGLAYVSAGSVTAVLPSVTAAALPFAGAPPQLAITGAANATSFVLLPSHVGADLAGLSASITAADAGKGIFTLVLKWSKQVTGVTLAGLNAAFGYVLKVTPPPGGFSYPPAVGTITLLGGADPSTSTAPATPAQAVVVAA